MCRCVGLRSWKQSGCSIAAVQFRSSLTLGPGPSAPGPKLIAELREAGLKGLEVYTSYHDESASEYYLNIAKKLRLIPSAGSDFHGRIKPRVAFGSVRTMGRELIYVLQSYREPHQAV